MNNLSGVYRMVKQKISNETAAYRLRMSLAEYRRQKDIVLQILHTLTPTIDKKIIDILDNYDPAKPVKFTMEAEEEVSKIVELHTNMEDGTAKLTAISSVEPKTPEQIIEAAQAGVNGYVVKPFTAQALSEFSCAPGR